MKKFVIQFIILAAVILAALMFSFSGNVDLPFLPQRADKSQATIGNAVVKIEIADTPSKRQKGLGGRESLATDSGMLFIFDESKVYQFWMKGLKFPLDMIWIREGKVVDIIKNATPPLPNTPDENLPLYIPNQPVDMVLEVNSGFVDTHLIQVGDMIKVER